MPEKAKTTNEDLNISPEDLAKISDPFGMAKEWLKSENGERLLREVKGIQQELSKKGLKLEDHLIVGNKTLKEATKNWDKKHLNKEENVAIYSTLYIAACNKKDVPVTFICPQLDGKNKEKNFNSRNKDILDWKDEVKNTLWDKIWDSICAAFGVVTPHSKELMAQEHRLKVDQIRTQNLKKAFLKETEGKYLEAKSMVDSVTAEEKKWEKLFLKEGEEKLPELPKELKDQLKKPYNSMSPIEMCMSLTSKRIAFTDRMTPETMAGSDLNQIKEVGELYRSFVKAGNLNGLKQELYKDAKEMSFTELGTLMEKAVQQSGCGPAVEVDGVRKVNTAYNPFSNEKVKEKAISLMPMLKHSVIDRDTQSIGSIMAKHFYGMMENSAKMYEAIKEHREKDYFPIVSKIAQHQVPWTYVRNMAVLDADREIDQITQGRDSNLSSIVRPEKVKNIGGDGLYSFIENKQRIQSPLGTAMLYTKCGFEGMFNQLGLTLKEGQDPTFIGHRENAWSFGRTMPDKINAKLREDIAKADKEYGEVEVQKEVKPESKQADPELDDLSL